MIPRLIFWETTRSCNLQCLHCRAEASPSRQAGELQTHEAKRLVEGIASFSTEPLLVFSGGEPLSRKDLFILLAHARSCGLKTAVATNATLITESVARRLKENDVKRVAVSIYGYDSAAHDAFCGYKGAFDRTLSGIRNLKEAGIALQINATMTKKNLHGLEATADFAQKLGAVSYHPFFIVPTGRGRLLSEETISAGEYEYVFRRLRELTLRHPRLEIKVTCAPHYYRFLRQIDSDAKKYPQGCLSGDGVCFISYRGEVFGCGYLPISAGDLLKESFGTIWRESGLFQCLRDVTRLKGKCGMCEFKNVGGGCRARAYQETADYLGEEPECAYRPVTVGS